MWRQEVFPEAVLQWTSPINRFLQLIYHNCGHSKDFVATKVANVATGTIWLDNADLIDAFAKVCITDLEKLPLACHVGFGTSLIFANKTDSPKEWFSLQKWSNWTRK